MTDFEQALEYKLMFAGSIRWHDVVRIVNKNNHQILYLEKEDFVDSYRIVVVPK